MQPSELPLYPVGRDYHGQVVVDAVVDQLMKLHSRPRAERALQRDAFLLAPEPGSAFALEPRLFLPHRQRAEVYEQRPAAL